MDTTAMSFCRIWFIVIVAFLDVNNVSALRKFNSSAVTTMLETSMGCHRNPAMAVAVVKDGKTIYSRGFGYLDLNEMKPVSDESVFSVASITKSFSAALLVKLLYEKTNLTLNSKVKEFLGDQFVMPDEWRTEKTTFLDLLSHKTALLSNNAIRYDSSFTRETLLSRLSLLPSTQQFRVNYIYNNLVYGLVGRLAELIGGKRWEDLVTEHLFTPLGMSSSTFSTTVNTTNRSDLVSAYREWDAPGKYEKVTDEMLRKWAEMCSSGSIRSSVKDMTKWINFHLSGGKNEKGKQVMEGKLVRELHKGRLPVYKMNYIDIEKPKYPVTSYTNAYALGLRVGHYREYPLISHTGTTSGFASYMTILPRQKIGVISLFSGDDKYYRHRSAINQYLLDSALGVTPYLNSKTICSYPNPWLNKKLEYFYRPTVKAKRQFLYKTYKGTYSHPAYGSIEISHNRTKRALVMTYGFGLWELIPRRYRNKYNEQRFYAKGIEPVSPTDISRLHFIPHPKKNQTVIGVRGTYFEKKLPPIFCKSEYLNECNNVISLTQPEWNDAGIRYKTSKSQESVSDAFYHEGRLCKSVCFNIPNVFKESCLSIKPNDTLFLNDSKNNNTHTVVGLV